MGKRRFTKKLAVLTLFSGLAFNSIATTSEDYEKALKAYNVSQYDEAYIHLKNSLQKDPQNLAAKILMGQILLINGYLTAAEQEFVEALEMGADINLLAEPLGNTWLFLNKYNSIISFQDTEKLSGENRRQWLQIHATACTRIEDLDCAKTDYETILNDFPNDVSAINGLAAIALQNGNIEKATQLIAQSESLDSDNAVTWRLKGQLAYQEGNSDAATEYLQKALTFDRDDPIALRNLVDLYLQAKDYDRAKTFVAEIIKDTPNDPLAILLNSWLESRQSKNIIDNEKLQQLNEFMAQLSPELIASQPMLLYISGLTNFFNNNMEMAAKDFSNYLQREPDDVQAVMMLSQVYMATQQYKQALVLLEKNQRALLDNLDSSLILGDLFIKQNKAFKAQRLLQTLESRYPNNAKLQLFKIKLMAVRGKQQEALAILNQNFDKNKDNSTFLFTYALMHLQAGNYDQALNGAQRLIEMYPDEGEVYNLVAGILIRQGKLTEAKENILKALELNPVLFPAKFNLAATESRLGNINASNELVEELLTLSPQHIETLLLKAFNATRQGNVAAAKQLYLDILVISPNNVAARQRLISIYQAEKDPKTALYHLEKLLKDNFDNPDYLLTKAELHLALNEQNDARKSLNIVRNFIQGDAPRLLRFSELSLALGDEENALKAMADAQKTMPDSTIIKLSHVRLLIQLQQVTEAAELLETLTEEQTQNPNYWYVRGLVYAAKGNDDEAVKAYQRAISYDPNFSQPFVSLYNYALQERYVDVFLQQSKKISSENPNNLLVRNLHAQYLFFIRDYEQARPLYEALVKEPNLLNPAQAYNRLALMTIDTSLEKATEYILHAYELSPNSAKILDTYGWINALQGNYEESLKLLRDAFSRDAKDPNIRYHLGYALAKMGRIDEAKEELTYAVTVQRPFFLRPQAQSLLDSL